MKILFRTFIFFILILYSTGLFSQDANNKVSNPVVMIYDGCIERFMGYYYAMGTGTVGKIYQSKNLVTWSGPTLAAETNEATWLDDPKWTQAYTYKRVGAGDILYRNGVFHIYFNGIGHSYSNKPLGMFKEHSINEPFDDYGIDAQVFQDEDGELYYLKKVNPDDPHPVTGGNYGKNGAKIWTFRMNSPFIRKGIPGSEQMTHQIGHPTNVDWVNFEGPELFKYRDNYYLMYSPNRMSARTGMYETGVAQSDKADDFTNQKKYPHPVLTRNMENHHFIYSQLLNSGEHGGWSAKYKTSEPSGDWTSLEYNETGWGNGIGGFGLQTMDIARIRSNRTLWNTNQIYIRRKFQLVEVPEKLALKYRVEANTDFYINGNKLTINQSSPAYSLINVDPGWFVQGENIIAVKAENSCSGSNCFKFVDFGLFDTKGQDAEKIVIGQSQANHVAGPNGFERWIMYKGFFNGLSSQGIDRMHFYDKELVVESTSTLNSPGYHPVPSMPTFISYFDHNIYYPYKFLNNSDWKIGSGVITPKEDTVSELLFLTDSMTNYRYEIPFRIFSGNSDYMAVYACYIDKDNWVKIKIDRDNETWEYEIVENGVSIKQSQALPDNFKFLEDHPLVASYEEPWHTLTIYKNGGNFKIELDYFNLTLNGLVETNFTGSGMIGLIASSRNVSFDAVQYTNGWDEWDNYITGWEIKGGDWIIDKSGLNQTKNSGKSLAVKGDKNRNYEFSVYMSNDHIPTSGKVGFYPLYADKNNFVEAVINYSTGKLDLVNKQGEDVMSYSIPLSNNISRQYILETYPTTSYRYDFRSETEVSGVDVLWFEGNYPYLKQTFDLPEQVRFYGLQNGNWVPLATKLEGELSFARFNKFTFDSMRTKAIKMEVTPQTGKSCRAFSAYFQEELASSYYLRARRENEKLYIFVNDSLKFSLDGNWNESNVGLFTEATQATFNGILSYQTGKIPVTKIKIPDLGCAVGETIELTVEVEPLNATNKNLVWISSDPVIASIDENNRITRHTDGKVSITAWSADGGIVKDSIILGETNNISEIYHNSISIFPNPVQNELIINSVEIIVKAEVYSLPGNKIMEKTMESNREVLNVSSLDKGMYLLSIQTQTQKLSTKFIKN